MTFCSRSHCSGQKAHLLAIVSMTLCSRSYCLGQKLTCWPQSPWPSVQGHAGQGSSLSPSMSVHGGDDHENCAVWLISGNPESWTQGKWLLQTGFSISHDHNLKIEISLQQELHVRAVWMSGSSGCECWQKQLCQKFKNNNSIEPMCACM